MATDLFYEYDHDGPDEVIDEANNSYLALRKVRWNPNSEYRLDIRKYFIKGDGTEVVGKGVSFFTNSGPDTLVNTLIQNGYGNLKEVGRYMTHSDDGINALCYSVSLMNDKDYESFKEQLDVGRQEYINKGTKSATDVLDSFLK